MDLHKPHHSQRIENVITDQPKREGSLGLIVPVEYVILSTAKDLYLWHEILRLRLRMT